MLWLVADLSPEPEWLKVLKPTRATRLASFSSQTPVILLLSSFKDSMLSDLTVGSIKNAAVESLIAFCASAMLLIDLFCSSKSASSLNTF
jgi:hypothetical protein